MPYCWGCDVEKVSSGFRSRSAANLLGNGLRSCNAILQGRSPRGDEPMSVITPFTCASATLRPPGGETGGASRVTPIHLRVAGHQFRVNPHVFSDDALKVVV